MKLYADAPGRRVGQLLRDAAVPLLVWLFVRLGRAVHDLIAVLAEPGAVLERAGDQLAAAAQRGAEGVRDLPAVGGTLARPFESVAGSGQTLAEAGVQGQQAVLDAAFWLGVVAAVLPILVLLALYLPGRIRWIREATAASGLRHAGAELELFALRAVARRPLADLRRVSSDPLGDYRAGRWQALAALELDELGLRG